jgi:mannose-6-phosphate isomerase-like protein (cupin superfamily)
MPTSNHTALEATPFGLDRRLVLHLGADLSITALAVDEGTWSRPDGLARFVDGRLLAIFDYDATWTWWERHPVGDELVHVLAGSVVLRVHDDAQDGGVALAAGDSFVIPEGTWHSADIDRPAQMLFVTPTPARTEHRRRDGVSLR